MRLPGVRAAFGPNASGEIWPKDPAVRAFDGTQIRYTLLGPDDTRVVTFCAGFICPDTFWKYLVPGLVLDHRLLVWNYRGVGVSGLPRRAGYRATGIRADELSIENNARDLAAILAEEGIERTALVGHSMGVQVILECYRQFPERVAALVCLAGAYRSPLRTFYGTDLGARAAGLGLPALQLFPRASVLLWRALLSTPLTHPVAQLIRGLGPETKAEDMRGFYDHLARLDPLVAAKMIRGMHEHSAEDVLDRIDVPTLICHGTRDTFTPPRVARVMARRIRGAELVFFTGASHGLPLERPDEILMHLRATLDRGRWD